MAWNGNTPNAPNWAGTTEDGGSTTFQTLSVTQSTPPAFSNPTISISDGNTVDLPRRYNDFAVNNLTATKINGNPNFDASNWWRYVAKGDVTAELAPPPIIPPTPFTRQYDLTGWKEIKCTNLTCEVDPLLGGIMTCAKAVAPRIVGVDADFSTSESGTADVNIYGANLVAGDNSLYVEGGTTLTGGGVVHGITIGALRAGPIDTVRIDVLPVGMSLESATFITANAVGAANISAGGAVSVAAGGAVSIAGGSYIEYNTDQNYFRNTSAGNDYTDIYVGNIHGADGGSAALRISENRGVNISSTNGVVNIDATNGGVNINGVKTMNMYSDIVEWKFADTYDVSDVVYLSGFPYTALVKNKALSPFLTNAPAWVGNTQYYANNIVFVPGLSMYRCVNDVFSTISPNGDPTNWVTLSTGGSAAVSNVWQSGAIPSYTSTIIGDKLSTLTNGVVNTGQINLATSPVYADWDDLKSYDPGDIVLRSGFYYMAQIFNINVAPNGSQPPTWVSGGVYVVGNFVYTLLTVYQCILDVSGSAVSPNTDTTHWSAFPSGMIGIWKLFTPPVVVSTINGDDNSVLTIGTINAQNLITQTSIDTITISTNSITPHSGSSITINSGDLNLADNNIVGITTLSTRNLSAPAGNQIHLQADVNGESQDGSLRSLLSMNLLQARCEGTADASVDFVYADGETLAMEIAINEASETASIRADIPLTITAAETTLNLEATGTAIGEGNLILTATQNLDLNAPNNAVRINGGSFYAIGEQAVEIAAANQDLTLTATRENINFNAPDGLVISNADFQLFNSRFGIPDTDQYLWVRAWTDSLMNYSPDTGTTWRPIAQDWSKFSAEQNVDMNGYTLAQVGGIEMTGFSPTIQDVSTISGLGGTLSFSNTNVTDIQSIVGITSISGYSSTLSFSNNALTNIASINGNPTLYPFRVYRDVDNMGVDLAAATPEIQVRATTLTLKANSPYQINMGYSGLVQNASLPSNQQNNNWYFIVRVHPGTTLTSTNIISAPSIFNNTQIGSGTSQGFMTTSGTTYTVRWYIRNQHAGGVRLTIPNMFANINEIQ